MAVTINSTPKPMSPSGNPLVYTFSSNQTAQPNFSYIVETYVNAAKAREERIFPQSGIRSFVDISETVDALVQAPKILSGLSSNSQTIESIFIIVRENYGNPPVNSPLSATSAVTLAFKGCVDNKTFETIDFDADWKAKKWLTNHPTKDISILRNQRAICSMLVNSSQTLEVKIYNSSNSLLGTYTSTQNNRLWQVNITNAVLLGMGFSQPNIDNTAYITLQIGTSEILTYRFFDEYCHSPKSLLWTNEYGSFDTFIFEHFDIRSGQVTGNMFKKQFGEWSGGTYIFDSLNSGEIDYSKNKITKGSLVSDYMSEQQHDWLVELYNSTFYILFNESGLTESVRVTKTSYEYLSERFEDLIMEQVDYVLSNSQNSPRR
jgi:hypothetical protein